MGGAGAINPVLPHISKKHRGPRREIGGGDSARIFCDPSARGAAGSRREIMLVQAEGVLVVAGEYLPPGHAVGPGFPSVERAVSHSCPQGLGATTLERHHGRGRRGGRGLEMYFVMGVWMNALPDYEAVCPVGDFCVPGDPSQWAPDPRAALSPSRTSWSP